MHRKLLGIISMYFNPTGQLQIIYSALIKYFIKNGNRVKQCFSKKAYDSVSWEVLYYILNEFGIPMKPVKLIKVCLFETYSRVQVGKHLSDMFPN
jgi:hypothetical protein